MDQAAGARMKRAMHVARERMGITSDVQLALDSGVSYDTLHNWYSGRTVPRPAEVQKVARVLGVPYGDLIAAYEGREPSPQPLQDAIRDLVAELRASRQQQQQATEALTRALDAVLKPKQS